MNINRLVFTALATVVIPVSLQSVAFATEPMASGKGAVAVRSTVSGGFAVGSNGSSTSYAHNSQSATATIAATAAHTPRFGEVHARIIGSTTTNSSGIAYNVSTGSGFGYAMSSGSTAAHVGGVAGIEGVTTGLNGGSAGTITNNSIFAGPNSGGYVVGAARSGFDTHLDYWRSATGSGAHGDAVGGTRTSTVGISSQSTGYASGMNASGAIEGMNAAGLINIGSAGGFFAKSDMSASTGKH